MRHNARSMTPQHPVSRLGLAGVVAALIVPVSFVSHEASAQGVDEGGQFVVWGSMVQHAEFILPYAQLVAGMENTVALRADGSVACWGSNYYGESMVPVSAITVRQIAAGAYHGVALRLDGSVICWGANTNSWGGEWTGQCIVPAELPPAVAVAAGANSSMAVLIDGSVRCWGAGATTFNAPPSGLTGVASVDGGWEHTIALLANGSVRCWGNNSSGQLNVPTDLAPSAAVSAGFYHSVAMTIDGAVLCWGANWGGQSTVPPDLGMVTAVSAGTSHTVALKSDGSIVCWGSDFDGQCTAPPLLAACRTIAAGGAHTVAIEIDGDVRGWGLDQTGQTEPPARAGLVRSIDAGWVHLVAARDDGTVGVWGYNYEGAAEVPTAVAKSRIVTVSAGNYHNLALSEQGEVFAWGSNLYGQCAVPTQLGACIAIGAGYEHSVALRGGSLGVVCWGNNSSGQCSPPPELTGAGTSAVEVAGGGEHSLARLSNGGNPGAVVCWGGNSSGQCSVPSDLGPALDADAGHWHNVALTMDHTVRCWGYNQQGQISVPEGLGPIVDVAAGMFHTLALQSDGRVVAWGYNKTGQSSVPPSVKSVNAISGGGDLSMAIVEHAHSVCTNPGGAGQTATLRTSGCRWEEISIWDWTGGIGSNVPGPGSTVDLGAYGSVGSACDAACATLHAHGGSSILVPVDLTIPASGQPDHSIDVSDTANLAGRVWLIGTGAATLPLDLNIPVLRTGNPVAGFDIVQTTVPAPAGYFLALVPSAGVQGSTLYSLRLLPLQSSDGLVGSATGSFSGQAIAAEAMDWNGDGFDDLALAIDFGAAQNGQLQVMLNDGTGNLGLTSLLVATPPVPTCLAVGDLNGDGKSDAVVGTASDQLVHLYYNNAPTMAPAFTVGPVINPNGMPLSVVVMQPPPSLQGMGGDVGVGSNGGTSGETQVASYSGTTGAGSGDPLVVSTTPTTTTRRGGRLATGGSSSSSVDGVMPVSAGRVSIIEWRQVGTPAVWRLTEVQVMDVPGSPVAIEMADIDGDGLDEIVTANADPQYQGAATTLPVLTMFRGLSGATAFGSAIPIAPEGASIGRDISLIDIDNDGDRDLISVQQTLGTQTTASTIRIDTAGPGGAMTIGTQSAIDAQHPTLCTRGNIDGVGGEDLFLVDDGGASLVGGGVQLARPFLGDPGVIPCPADVSGDGTVNGLDLGIMLGEWGGSGSADVNNDGIVNGSDLGIILRAWGPCAVN